LGVREGATVDEPTNGELGRRMDGLQHRLDRTVPLDVYQADQRLVQHRLDEVASAAKETSDSVRGINDRLDAAAEKRVASWRQALYMGIIPFAVGILMVLATLWAAKGGK
jgi:hypothetical protein